MVEGTMDFLGANRKEEKGCELIDWADLSIAELPNQQHKSRQKRASLIIT